MGINELFQKIMKDKGFAAKYQALESADDWIAQAKEDGYAVTKAELDAAFQKAKSDELSDEDMADVAGGIVPIFLYGKPPKEV